MDMWCTKAELVLQLSALVLQREALEFSEEELEAALHQLDADINENCVMYRPSEDQIILI